MTMRPRLLDLFCGAGGAAMGYHRAGFDVVGVDIKPQSHYPFEFIQADAVTFPLEGFGAIHASPPCQRYSTIGKQNSRRSGKEYPDLYEPIRARLQATGVPWVVENVIGAPYRSGFVLCGSKFGLDVRRHRNFETSHLMMPPLCNHQAQAPRFRTPDKRRSSALASVVGVYGNTNYAGHRSLREAAMGIDWMTMHELTQAIPPAYTEWIGAQLLAAMKAAA